MAWLGKPGEVVIAVSRMAVQLIAMGYVLTSIFANPSPAFSLIIVSLMLVVAAWISIRPIRGNKDVTLKHVMLPASIALASAVGFHLFLSIIFVLQAESWFAPQLLIPLAGMYLANTMNAISLSAERYFAELKNLKAPEEAKLIAFRAAMIPQVNSLLAVGLVSLPGMMTGQILSGVSPLIAVRYQIMIMTMCLGTSGLGSAIMLWLMCRSKQAHQP